LTLLGVNLSNISKRDFSLYFGDRSGEDPRMSPKEGPFFPFFKDDPGKHRSNPNVKVRTK
jgi:hypothetical protein